MTTLTRHKASHRDLTAFWTVVPRFLNQHRGNMNQRQMNMVPQFSVIFVKTMEKVHHFGPRDLTQFTSAFSKIIDSHDQSKTRRHGGGIYHQFLYRQLTDDKKRIIFRFIVDTARPLVSQFDQAQVLANLVHSYALALVGIVPTFDDGITLFHDIAEKSIPLLGNSNHRKFPTLCGHLSKLRYHILGSLRQ